MLNFNLERMPAMADNTLQKTYIQTSQASFATEIVIQSWQTRDDVKT